jgi:hypothetical protein
MLENLNPASRVEAPSEFRAALEFDGEQGTATLPVGTSNFQEFLIEQGFDPAEFEIVGAPRTSRWQKYDGDWLTSYRFNFRKISSAQDLGLLWRTAKRNAKASKPLLRVSKKALVVMLSDFQIGRLIIAVVCRNSLSASSRLMTD